MKHWLCRFAILVVALSIFPARAQPALEPVHWSADVQLPPALHAGSRFSVLLHAHIDEGWHLYALPDKDASPLSTEVALAKNASADLLRVEEEKHHRSIDPESHVVTGWFARSTTFTLHLAATAGAPRDLQVLVRYQACNERMCLPAKQVRVPVLPLGKP